MSGFAIVAPSGPLQRVHVAPQREERCRRSRGVRRFRSQGQWLRRCSGRPVVAQAIGTTTKSVAKIPTESTRDTCAWSFKVPPSAMSSSELRAFACDLLVYDSMTERPEKISNCRRVRAVFRCKRWLLRETSLGIIADSRKIVRSISYMPTLVELTGQRWRNFLAGLVQIRTRNVVALTETIDLHSLLRISVDVRLPRHS